MHVKKGFNAFFVAVFCYNDTCAIYYIWYHTFFCPLVFNLCSSARMVENVQMVPCSSLLHVSGVEREGDGGG